MLDYLPMQKVRLSPQIGYTSMFIRVCTYRPELFGFSGDLLET